MSSDSLSQFLGQLYNSQLLNAGQIEELIRRPEMPNGDLDSVAAFLEQRGWLTRFQIDRLRDGRSNELHIDGGYRLTDLIEETSTATVYKATQLALQRPIVLRLIRPESLAPCDNADDYLARVHAVMLLSHPHLVNALDSGTIQGRPYVAGEYVVGSTLSDLVRGMGPMPLTLASDYVYQAALALHAAHDKGIVHGELSPASLLVTPVIQSEMGIQPGPGAHIKVAGLCRNPRRPLLESTSIAEMSYRSPERFMGDAATPAADVFALGGILYSILSGQPPFPATNIQDAMHQGRTAEPQPIEAFRPDVPPQVSSLIRAMLAKSPQSRPDMRQVADTLRSFVGPNSTVVTPLSSIVDDVPVASLTNSQFDEVDDFPLATEVPMADPPTGVALGGAAYVPMAMAEIVEDDGPAPHALPVQGFTPPTAYPHTPTYPPSAYPPPPYAMPAGDVQQDLFSASSHEHEDDDDTPRPRPSRKADQSNMTLWMVFGALLHGTAILLLVGWALGWFSGSTKSNEPAKQYQKPSKYPKPPH